MSMPKSTTYGLLAMGMVLSVVAALEISAPSHVQDEFVAPLIASEPAPERSGVAALPPRMSSDGPPLQVQLSAVATGPGGARAALVSVNSAPPVLVRIGDPLIDASTVQAIGDDWLAYTRGTAVVRVRIQERETLAPATGPNLVAAAPAAPVMLAATQPGAEPGNGNEEFRQAMKQKMASMKP